MVSHPSAIKTPVLILGAGINGCAVARELALNGVPVWIVEQQDISFGATSRASRLIHGGLRYLEYGEFRLVRESLRERRRLLELAPHYVHPLRLYIPVSRRTGGLWYSILKYFSGTRIPLLNRLSSIFHPNSERGLWLVRLGLWLYDRFSRDGNLPGSSVQTVTDSDVPVVNREAYRWLCAYTDAQMPYPERFTLAMLDDAQRLATANQVELKVFTHAKAQLSAASQTSWEITNADGQTLSVEPSAVINATGAWGDITLDETGIEHEQLLGGTRGSHLVTGSRRLREAIGEDGIYAETSDGRLVFILPFGKDVLVGTTDVRHEGRPEKATATAEELDYLIDLVNSVVPDAQLQRADVDMHYSGVRPLPYQPEGKTAAISRDHSVHHHQQCRVPTFTLIGGKLTTCRAFAELVADRVFRATESERFRSSKELLFSGAEDYPKTEEDRAARQADLAAQFDVPEEMIRQLWILLGTRTAELLEAAEEPHLAALDGTSLPLAMAYWSIDHEHARTLDDLVDRRLMLVYHKVTEPCLKQLASCLVDRGLLQRDEVDAVIDNTTERLRQSHGKGVIAAL